MIDKSVKLRKIGKIYGDYQRVELFRRDIIRTAHLILEKMNLLQFKFGVSQESLARARSALNVYSRQPFMLRMSKASRLATFQSILAEALKKLGYSIKIPSYFRLKHYERFDMIATRHGHAIGIDYFFGTVNDKAAARTARCFEPEVSERWIICSGSTKEAQRVANDAGINIILVHRLLDELDPQYKEFLWQKFTQLMHGKAASIVDRKSYPQLRAALRAVHRAKTSAEKGRSFERLAECFVELFPKLEVVGRNIRIEAEELDLVVKNEVEKIFWHRLGAPIIIECKNWTKPVGAAEIRDLVLKMREVRTAFLFAAHGVTTKNGAYYEIIEARKKTKFILIFDVRDIEDIFRGADPEEIVKEKFYSLWT